MSEEKKKTVGVENPETGEKQEVEIPTRRVKVLMVNPADFMVLFTKGMQFAKKTTIVKGLPDDAKLLTVASEPVRNGVMFVVESKTYDPIPQNQTPPVEMVEIQQGTKGGGSKKPIKKRKK